LITSHIWIIIKWIFKTWDGGGGDVGWIDLAEDRDRWWAVVNASMNLRVPGNVKDFSTI